MKCENPLMVVLLVALAAALGVAAALPTSGPGAALPTSGLGAALPISGPRAAPTGSPEAALGPACRPHTDCKLVSYASRQFFFDVNGVSLIVMFLEEKHLKVWCDASMFADAPPAADAAALPALAAAAAVQRLAFSGCRLPASFAGAMAALNVTAAQDLEIIINENDTLLQRHHFAGLDVPSLTIRGGGSDTEDDFLADATGLLQLQLYNLRLSERARENLPVALTKLILHDALMTPVGSLRWLERLRSLSILNIFQGGEDAPLTPPLLGPFRNLTDVVLQVPLELPALWLRGSALRSLGLHGCALRGLRADTLAGANLTRLSITKDDLSAAPAGLVSGLRWLRALDVSQSRLGGAALRRLAGPLPRLWELRASHNPLGSLCGHAGVSFKAPSGLPRSLRRLHLRGTNATALCSDWLDDDHALEYIDLSLNNIDTLEYESLRMMRLPQEAREVRLVLTDNPLADVLVRAHDEAACRAASAAGAAPRPLEITQAAVRLSLGALHCDCRNARLRALAARCPLVRLEPAPCRPPPPTAPRTALRAAPADFLDYLPEELLCQCPADYNFSVPGCTCGKRLQDNATVVECAGAVRGARWPRSDGAEPLALAVRAGAGLHAVPAAALLELRAANNSVTTLAEDDISDTLLVLDLRNNSIEHISVETARRLGSPARGGRPRRIWLAGNPLACRCADRAALEALRSARVQAQLQDWRELRCRDGRELASLVPSELCLGALVPAVAVAGALLLLLALTAPLALRWARPRLKQFLFDRHLFLGWVLRADDTPDDPTKTHDVFISYAYADRRLAMKLRQWLDDRGFSTVEHSRDWLAGVPVDEHIANSVTCARRTLLLVSDSFAASAWGLQEFHAAHAHVLERGSARIIPVRCQLSDASALPPELRLYLYNNTYLSYDDPEFWSKLLRVLPRRAHADPAPPPPPPPPPPPGKEPPLAAQFEPARDAPAAC